MKRLAVLPLLGLGLLAACADSATGPTIRPSLTTVFSSETAPNGAHYANSAFEPVCTVLGLTLSCTGSQINGVGNTNADLLLSVVYTATVRCRNHGGKIVDVKTQVVDDGAIDTDLAPKNGNLVVPAIDVAEGEAPTDADFLAQAVCPNPNWTKLLLEGTPAIESYSYTLTFVGFAKACIVLPSV